MVVILILQCNSFLKIGSKNFRLVTHCLLESNSSVDPIWRHVFNAHVVDVTAPRVWHIQLLKCGIKIGLIA